MFKEKLLSIRLPKTASDAECQGGAAFSIASFGSLRDSGNCSARSASSTLKVMRKKDGECGSALVEMALVLLLLISLTMGVMEYGWMFIKVTEVTNAAREGARQAILPDATNASVTAVVDGLMEAADIAGATVSFPDVPYGDVSSPETGQTVRVRVSAPYVALIGLPVLPTPAKLEATVAMAKEGA